MAPKPLDYRDMNRFATRSIRFQAARFFSAVLLSVLALVSTAATAELHIQATPDGGVQPRLSVDDDGNVHLLYFKKRISSPSAREGNLYYRQYQQDQQRFGVPVKVSSEAFDIRTFSIARASMAVGGDGRIHAIWYLPRDAQYFYTRSDTQRSMFEAQRPVVEEFGEGLDAGADVAALGSAVAVVWGAGDLSREYERTVYGRLSTDSGASFSSEMQMGDTALGACACCSLATDFEDENSLAVAYRSAIDGVGRHMQALSLQFADETIQAGQYASLSPLQEWELSACPLSTNDITADASAEQWLVFETEGRIVQLKLQEGEQARPVGEPFIETRQKNPAIAINAAGERLVVWGEAISHPRGGRLNMRLFDESGVELETGFEREIEMPQFSFPAAAQLPNGDFLVLY